MQNAVRFTPAVPELAMPEKESVIYDSYGIFVHNPQTGEVYADAQGGYRLWVENYSPSFGGYVSIDQTDNVYVIRDEFIPDNTGDPMAYARTILERAASGEFDSPNATPKAPGARLTEVGWAIGTARNGGSQAELAQLSMADALAALLGGASNAGMNTMSRIAHQLNSGDTTPLLSLRRVCGEDSVPPMFYMATEADGFRGAPQHVCCGCNPNEIREFAARGFLVSGVSWYGRDEDGWTARLDLECDQEGRVVHLYYTCKDEEGNLVLSLDAPDQEAFRKRAWDALVNN